MTIEIKINGEAAELHDVLRALLNSTAPQPEANTIDLRKSTKAPAKAKEPTPQPATAPEPQTPEPQAPEPQAQEPQAQGPTTHTFEEFRYEVGAAALKDKAAVKAVLQKYDATKTSEVIPELYAECIADLKAIN